MDDAARVFEERLQRDNDLKGRALTAILISMVLYPSFLLLDLIYTPQFFHLFLIIRLVVVALHGVLLFLYTRTKTNRGYARLGMAMVVFDALGIALMIQIMGGFFTSYYQGLNIIVMGMVVVIPLAFRDSLILYAITWASYAIPSFLTLGHARSALPAGIAPGNEWRFLVNNLFFLTAIIIVGAFGSFIMDAIRRRELRTPLTLMLAPLSPMIDGQMGRIGVKQKETIATIRQNGFKLLKLINNLLDLTKLEEGKMRLKIRTVDFVEYIKALLASVKPLTDRKKITLYFQHPSDVMNITLDPEHFEKVVLNLLSNAIKFTPEGGRITVYLEDRDKDITLIVEDTGIGLPADMLDSIFDRFSQVDGSLSRPHEGTGIGLSLAREIVRIHGGRIRVESELKKGSRFIVVMLKGEAHFAEDVLDRRQADQPVSFKKRVTDAGGPRVQDIITDFRKLQLVDLEREEVAADLKERDKKHAYRLLVVDDNPEVLKLMKLLLSEEFDLDFATSGEGALVLLHDRAPDLVLSDVMMPGMDGQTLCRKIRSEDSLRHIPVILVTARSGSEMLAEGIEAGADDYIAKPFDSVELKARVRSLLRMRRAEAELALVNQNLKVRTTDLVERQRALFLSMIKSLVSALDAKDRYTRDHSTRVTEFTLRIAEKMGLNEREMKDLELASILHDVGKIAVPEKILNKRSRLTEEEFAYIKQHPIVGENILKPIIELQQVAIVVRHHHERYDGRGYPDGLKSLEIPIGSRIMSVADTYDSITSARSYRNADSHNSAVKEIIKSSGKQFDPEVVGFFLEVAKTFAVPEKPAASAEAF
jgi:response regulator RpfG family c-di-GMP phosphodiesterase/signal transduction histidine kinase